MVCRTDLRDNVWTSRGGSPLWFLHRETLPRLIGFTQRQSRPGSEELKAVDLWPCEDRLWRWRKPPAAWTRRPLWAGSLPAGWVTVRDASFFFCFSCGSRRVYVKWSCRIKLYLQQGCNKPLTIFFICSIKCFFSSSRVYRDKSERRFHSKYFLNTRLPDSTTVYVTLWGSFMLY